MTRFRIILSIVLLLLAGTMSLVVFSHDDAVTVLIGGPHCSNIDPKAPTPPPNRIALVDQLGGQIPNPEFVERIGFLANKTGYGFDYYPSSQATLSMFLHLPEKGYAMIILRTHGTGRWREDPGAITVSDPYSQSQHITDQLLDRLTAIEVNGSVYFGLKPGFISQLMCGRFPGTAILVMGCNGIGRTDLARAFIDKGARVYIAWNYLVTVYETDLAFASLAGQLLEGKTVGSSIQNVTTALGPDPTTGAVLTYYPYPQENLYTVPLPG